MSPTTTPRRGRRLAYTAAIVVGLTIGTFSVAGAVTGGGNTSTPPGSSEETPGVDCVDGIDAATGAECDGGPAANPANDPNERADQTEG